MLHTFWRLVRLVVEIISRLIRPVIDIVRPSPVKIEIVQDLRRSSSNTDLVEADIAITPNNRVIHVVEGTASLVLEFEIVRINTIMVPDAKAGFHGSIQQVMMPKTVREKSVDSHRLDSVEILKEQALQPERVTFPVQLSVPGELPVPPGSAVSSVATWKLMATLRLTDGTTHVSEHVISSRG
jgi:hypothetical protein